MKTKPIFYPYMLWMTIFIVVPMLLVIFFAFTDSSQNFTFENIAAVGQYSGIFLKSIGLGALATLICLALSYPFAYIMSKLTFKRQTIFLMMIMIPMWINSLLRTYAWMTLLEDNGLINKLLIAVGLPTVHMINTSGAVVLGMVYDFLPFMILPLYSVLSQIDKGYIDAAQDLGANKTALFFRIIVPLSFPGIISGITMVFVPAVSTFIISKMLGGGSNLLIGDLIEMQFLGNSYNPNLGSALSLILMILILVCMGIMNETGKGSSQEYKGGLIN